MLLLLLLPLLSQAAEKDCTLNFAGLQGALEKAPEERDEKKRVLTQSVKLKSGEKAVFRTGGCEHLTYTFEFEGATFKRIKPANAFAAAEKLLKATPVTKDDTRKKLLLEALKQGAKKVEAEEPGRYKLPCGEAHCVLDVRLHKLISLTYDMAL